MIKRLWAVIRKEFMHILRDKRTLGMIFMFPIVMLFLFGYAVSFDVKHVPLVILDQSQSQASRDLVSRFINNGYFDLKGSVRSMGEMGRLLDDGKAKAGLVIPLDFSKQVASGQTAQLQVIIDGSDPQVASAALGYINGISQDYYRQLVVKTMNRRGISVSVESPLDLESRVWYNENLRSLNFFIPGLIAIILMMIAASLTSLTIVSEKEQGTLESLVVSPVRKYELLLGKILPYVFISFVDVVIVVFFASFWFGVPIKGSLICLFTASFIFLVGAMGMGLLISVGANSSQEAMMIALFASTLPTILLSGFVFPIENMPLFLQALSFLIPAKYLLIILRGVFLKGIGINYLWEQFVWLTVFSFIILGISARRFKKRIT